jgi:hypothetical protein
MLTAAVCLLSVTVALGCVLASFHLRGKRPPGWLIGVVHGACGAAALGVLALAQHGSHRAAAHGVGSFGAAATLLTAMALFVGLIIALLRARAARGIGLAIVVHGSLAVTAYVLLLAFAALR